MSLTCPKCQSDMRTYERNGVVVDQCTGCGGLFLDKGELEQLSAAENAWHQQPQQPQGGQHYTQPAYSGGGHKPHRKKRSFLSELFED